jgi:hypothetical protein
MNSLVESFKNFFLIGQTPTPTPISSKLPEEKTSGLGLTQNTPPENESSIQNTPPENESSTQNKSAQEQSILGQPEQNIFNQPVTDSDEINQVNFGDKCPTCNQEIKELSFGNLVENRPRYIPRFSLNKKRKKHKSKKRKYHKKNKSKKKTKKLLIE